MSPPEPNSQSLSVLVDPVRKPIGNPAVIPAPARLDAEIATLRTSKVLVVNPVRNGPQEMRRKDAEFYVKQHRAAWVADNQIRLIESHDRNIAAAKEAGRWDASGEYSAAGSIICRDANATTFKGVNGREHSSRRCRAFGGLPVKVTERPDVEETGSAAIPTIRYNRRTSGYQK